MQSGHGKSNREKSAGTRGSGTLSEAYVLALETRTQYRDSVWTRWGQFLTLQGFLVIGLGLAGEQFQTQQNDLIGAIGVAGVLFSLLWLVATGASKRSIEAWTGVLDELDPSSDDLSPIFELYQEQKNQTNRVVHLRASAERCSSKMWSIGPLGVEKRVTRYEYLLPGIVFVGWFVVVLLGAGWI